MDDWRQYRLDQLGLGSILGPLEREIMLAVWALKEATVGEVVEHTETANSYTTIKTVMERLCKKRLLSRRREGRSYLYRATLTRRELEAQASRRVVESLMSGFGSTALSQFAQVLRDDPDQLAALRRLLGNIAEAED